MNHSKRCNNCKAFLLYSNMTGQCGRCNSEKLKYQKRFQETKEKKERETRQDKILIEGVEDAGQKAQK